MVMRSCTSHVRDFLEDVFDNSFVDFKLLSVPPDVLLRVDLIDEPGESKGLLLGLNRRQEQFIHLGVIGLDDFVEDVLLRAEFYH